VRSAKFAPLREFPVGALGIPMLRPYARWLEIETAISAQKRDAGASHRHLLASALLPRPLPPATLRPQRLELKEYLASGGEYREREGVRPRLLPIPALEDLCLVEPSNLQDLRRVSGFGDKKSNVWQGILDAVRRFREGDRASNEGKPKVSSPAKETLRSSKKPHLEEIAQISRTHPARRCLLVADMIERGDASSTQLVAPNVTTRSPQLRTLGMDR